MRYAIIAAAGCGRRFGGKKQYEDINGKPMYQYSVDTFSKVADKIVIVLPEEDEEIPGLICVTGGKERYDSVYAALKAIDAKDDDLVAIHDAARPGVTKEVIERTYEAAEKSGAAVATVPVVDTVRTLDGKLIDRNSLRAMQTPQTFKYGVVRKAYDKMFERKDFTGVTDDVEVVFRNAGIKAEMVEGDWSNYKITVYKDLETARLEEMNK